MKSERISIFNYEAFYLDYLEGNLSEADAALLLAFLAQHPELDLGDDELPVLDVTYEGISAAEKNALKQTDDNEVITVQNIEYFLIAESEGVLNEAKLFELNRFIAKYPHFAKERELFGVAKLVPDATQVFVGKNQLKRKGAVVFWPYIALAAASVVVAFLLFNLQGPEGNQVADEVIPKEKPQQAGKDEDELTPVFENATPLFSIVGDQKLPVAQKRPAKQRNNSSKRPVEDQDGSKSRISPLSSRPARGFVNSVNLEEIQPIARKIVYEKQEVHEDKAIAHTGFEHMEDPIEPITKGLEKAIKRDVDFGTAKATENQEGGFFLKVGKFEISRKKGRK